MSDQRQAEKPLAIGDRRLHTRTPVTPQAFVKFGANNYGFVFNISENGLVFAPTGTLTLAVGAVAKMRFQLPDSKEWIETSGEVAWIAESQKEAGVRFVDLMEDTRVKIRNWISQEPLRPNPSQAQEAVRNAIASSQPNAPGAVPEDKILKSIFSDPGLFLVESKGARAKPAVQPPAVANEPPQATSAALLPERRSQPRRRVLSLEYLDLGDSNGGIILNLGEDGMYIQAVASLSPDHISNLSFKIPESGYQVETSGNIVWVGESRKDAGIQFDNLPEEARLKIREWVAEEFPVCQNSGQPQQPSDPAPFAAKPVPDARKHDRLVEMPPSAVPKSLPQSSSSPATRISDQKSGSVSKIWPLKLRLLAFKAPQIFPLVAVLQNNRHPLRNCRSPMFRLVSSKIPLMLPQMIFLHNKLSHQGNHPMTALTARIHRSNGPPRLPPPHRRFRSRRRSHCPARMSLGRELTRKRLLPPGLRPERKFKIVPPRRIHLLILVR